MLPDRKRSIHLYKTSFIWPTVGLHQVWGRTEIQCLITVLGGSMNMLRQGCSLSMLHRTCKKVHGVLGWVDWACPISCACLFILSPGVLRSTLSHIWCKLNCLYFFLSVRLLTLMYTDSLIVAAMTWSSLPVSWKLPCVVMWSVLWLWLCIGGGFF